MKEMKGVVITGKNTLEISEHRSLICLEKQWGMKCAVK